MNQFKHVVDQARSCRLCEACLPHAPRPILRGMPSARILIVGQAPGLKVHLSGLPFNDRSGDRLRTWLAIDRTTFYDESQIAFLPTGLCYPGRTSSGADLPPLKICAPTWHPQLLPFFSQIELVLLVGGYAQKYYLKDKCQKSLTDTVFQYRDYLPRFLPLPHPSWRNTGWLKLHPWFEEDIVPFVQSRVQEILKTRIGAQKFQ